MINDRYLEDVAKLLAGESGVIPSHLAFGSTTGIITATDIETSGEFDRNVLDTTSRTINLVKYIGTRTSAEASDELIRTVGLHNDSTLASSDNLQANFLLGSLIHSTDFAVQVEFWMKFIRG